MKITWLGHSCFKVVSDGGSVIFDPYENGSVPGLDDIHTSAQLVLCSHQHFDHNAVETVQRAGGWRWGRWQESLQIM